MRYFMLSAILFIVVTSTVYASPVHIELRDIASLDGPAIAKRLVRRVWPLSQSQDSLKSTRYELPSGLPSEMNFKDLHQSWKEDAVLAKDADSKLSKAHLTKFGATELKKPNAVMKYIHISGDRSSEQFKSRWDEIVNELGLLGRLYHDGDFVWGHSKGLDKVYIAIRAGKNKQIDVPKVSDPSERMALPAVQEFVRSRREIFLDLKFCEGETNWVLYTHRAHSRGEGALYI
ncbi:hypothetical protein F5887DRAFT_651402 [Amanita rubescens]|nr:hypothetical protein F5887DRAFT_651402 [Amanita rubescens]